MADAVNGAGGTNPPAPTVTAAPVKPGPVPVTFEIEFNTPQNNNTLCPITKRVYRGRFEMANVKARVPDDRFASHPDIPGHVIKFRGRELTVEIRDPMGDMTPEMKAVLKQSKAVHRDMNWREPDPDPRREIKLITQDQIKLWAYWARRWVDAGQVTVLSGKVPTMEEVEAMPGRVEYNRFDPSPKREKFPDMSEIPPYEAPELPGKKRSE